MRKWNIVLAVMGVTFAPTLPGTASAGTAGAAATLPVAGKSFGGVRGGMRPDTTIHRWGPRFQGRWYAGWYAPGGWGGYRRPVVGYVLPSYWVRPGFMIQNYGFYGLPAPRDGYRWSRYYDDAVMTDRDGRVIDRRGDVDWEGYDTLGDRDDGWYDDGVTYDHGYEGRWSGTWRDKDGKTFSGDYEGRFEGHADDRPGVDYDAPPYAAALAPLPAPYVYREVRDGAVITTTQEPGHIAGGYYYPAPTVTTVVIQPAMTTTRTYVTESVSRVRPRNRSHCRCK